MKSVAVAITVLAAFSAAFLRGEESPAPKAVTVPPLNFKHSSLPNGLEIYTVEDHSAPIVGTTTCNGPFPRV